MEYLGGKPSSPNNKQKTDHIHKNHEILVYGHLTQGQQDTD